MITKIGNITLNSEIKNHSPVFDILSLSTPRHNTRFGYVMVESTPIVSVEMYENELVENAQEKSQHAYNSFVNAQGKYNSLLCEDCEEQAMEFDLSLLDVANVDLYSFLDRTHFYVESKADSQIKFRFNIWDRELAEQVYNLILKAKNFGMEFDEYLMTYA